MEIASGSVTNTKQFIWANGEMSECRDGTGAVLDQYFPLGQKSIGVNYFFSKDRQWSIRELTNNSGVIQSRYSFDPFGRATVTLSGAIPDLQYSCYYFHAPSGLTLTKTRMYSATWGRWLSRDPIGETGGFNLYSYVSNKPVGSVDPSGLIETISTEGYEFDPEQNNCFGYASGIGFYIAPGPGQSFSGFLGAIPGHVRCYRLPVCGCGPGRFPFVTRLYRSAAGGSGDLFNDQTNPPFHSYVPEPGGGVSQIPFPGAPVQTQPAPLANEGLPYDQFCCCSDFPPNAGSCNNKRK